MNSGEVFDIFRGTTHDGPGLRTTVFFRGCPLHCLWCHNPEGISMTVPLWWDERRCIGCASCEKACPKQAVRLSEEGVSLDLKRCGACYSCVQACPTRALERISRPYTLEELLAELLRYTDYYRQFGGGVTASGGEAMSQCGFVTELFKALKRENIATALDTSGEADFSDFEKILPYTDCLLYDIKLLDSEQHKRFTGVSNSLILQNLEKILAAAASGTYGCDIWIRTPLIPGYTATRDNVSAIARYLKPYLGRQISRWELCSFNNACATKYRKLKRDWALKNTPVLQGEEARALRQAALGEGLEEKRVILTGIVG